MKTRYVLVPVAAAAALSCATLVNDTGVPSGPDASARADAGAIDANADANADADAAPPCSVTVESDAGTSCAGECVDLATDVNNCGSCGRTCPTHATCQGGRCSLTYVYTGAVQTFDVPDGISQVTVTAAGAQGQGGQWNCRPAGGMGGTMTATVPVAPSQALEIYVGSQNRASAFTYDGGGYNGGGGIMAGASLGQGAGWGGGASDVRLAGARLVVGGGGGGGGAGAWDGGAQALVCAGGAGGPGGGGNGGGGGAVDGDDGGGSPGGMGGSADAGGAGGGSDATAGGPGISGAGGIGGRSIGQSGAGGGGGGGYFGGGGGAGNAANAGGGGGGGGSSYALADAGNVIAIPGNNADDGYVTITFLGGRSGGGLRLRANVFFIASPNAWRDRRSVWARPGHRPRLLRNPRRRPRLPPADVDANQAAPSCTVNGGIYAPDAANPLDRCQVCVFDAGVGAWTTSANGSPCGADSVCIAGSCALGCWIDGGFVDAGVTLDNGCEICAPSTSLSAWTFVSGQGNCTAASVCNLGSRAPGCSIGGKFEAPDAASSDARCQICDPAQNTGAWTEICEPVLLANATKPQGLALDSTNVYWSNSLAWTVDYCPIVGCDGTALRLASSLPSYPQAIAVVGGTVYWEDYDPPADGYIQSCAVGAQDCTPTVLSSNPQIGVGFAVDADDIYWTTLTGSVLSCARAGCSKSATTLVSGLKQAGTIAVDATNVYVVSGANPQSVSKCSRSGCNETATPIATNLPGRVAAGGPSAIATDGTNVYVLVQPDAGGWAVESCAVDGCGETPTTLATGVGTPGEITVSGGNVFFTTSDDGGVFECPITGCGTNPTVLASGQNGAAFIAVNASYVFWVNYVGGQVQRLTR